MILFRHAATPKAFGLHLIDVREQKEGCDRVERLIKKARNGDKEAFVALMEENKLSMIAAARAILKNEEDVADALQETVLTAFQKLHSLREPKFFKTWLMRILINHSCGILRSKKLVPLSDYLPEKGDTPELDTAIDVKNSLCDLCESDRLVLTLYYLEDLRQKDIADILGISENAVKQRIARGKRHFKELYGKGAACNE